MHSTFATDHGTITDETVRTIKGSLRFIDAGVSREVFDLGDCVLKVDINRGGSFAGGCGTEAEAWDRIKGGTYEEFFCPVLASGDGWLVMAKVDGTVGWGNVNATVQRTIDAATYAGIRDLHPANLGWMPDGRCVAIDYAFQLDMPDYEERCDCCEHDCQDCYPDGCDCCCSLHNYTRCATYEGCCDLACEGTDCEHNANQKWQAEGFGFVPGESFHVCQDCHDRLAGKPAATVQCAGQGRFVDGWDGAGKRAFVFDAVTQHRLLMAEQLAQRLADEERDVQQAILASLERRERRGSARFVRWMRQGNFTWNGNGWTSKV